MTEFIYEPLFQHGEDKTKYRLLSSDYVKTFNVNGKEVLEVEPEALELLAEQAMKDVSFYLRSAHLSSLRKILEDPEASENDKFVARNLLENAVIAKEGKLPSCQDTGTAVVMAKKGGRVWTDENDSLHLSKGIYKTYAENNLRYSQVVAQSMFEEKNTGTNLPAQIDISAVAGNEYSFLFLAKGGGSANKTFLYQKTKSLLTENAMVKFVKKEILTLGTSACPPYHLAIVIGGTSAESTLKTVKLASAGYLDNLPTSGNEHGRAFRDLEWEEKIANIALNTGIGAQFGGKYFIHDVRVIRLSRHAASCPVGMGVSCSADRNIKGKITSKGIFLEQLETEPEKYLEGIETSAQEAVAVDLNRPMDEILKQLSQYPIKTRLSLSGDVIVARDMAHAKVKELVDSGKEMPEYFKNHPIYYAGPAKTPEGMPSGSFGPTTAGRMDPYVDGFMALGGSKIMLAKGNRSKAVRDACKKYGGFYLGSIGGPAAILAKQNILKVEMVDFEELGMEAIRKISVKNFPAFIVCDDKGNDFFEGLS